MMIFKCILVQQKTSNPTAMKDLKPEQNIAVVTWDGLWEHLKLWDLH